MHEVHDGFTEGRKLESQPTVNRKYKLKKIIEVDGRQGIATNGTHYFVSGSTALYVYDKDGNLLKKNEDPFAGLKLAANHFGDISYHNGEIYTGVEWFEDGRGQDIQIVLYDAETLNMTRSNPWDPDSGQVECIALAVDTDHNLVWMTDWVNGNYIYSYNLTNGEYVGKIHLRASPEWTQGIAAYKGDLYITADDGNADRREYDNLWKVSGNAVGTNATYISHEKAFTVPEDFIDFGEIEGIEFDKGADEMLVHANRGRQIILGMPKDFYPGYDREISEVYVFSITDEDTGSAEEDEDTESTEGNGVASAADDGVASAEDDGVASDEMNKAADLKAMLLQKSGIALSFLAFALYLC